MSFTVQQDPSPRLMEVAGERNDLEFRQTNTTSTNNETTIISAFSEQDTTSNSVDTANPFHVLNPNINWSLDEDPTLLNTSKWTLRFDNWAVELDYLRHYHKQLLWFYPIVMLGTMAAAGIRYVMIQEKISILMWLIGLIFGIIIGILATIDLGLSLFFNPVQLEDQQAAAVRHEYLVGMLFFLLSSLVICFHYGMAACTHNSNIEKSWSATPVYDLCIDSFPVLWVFVFLCVPLLGRPRLVIGGPCRIVSLMAFPLGRIGYSTLDSVDLFIYKYVMLWAVCIFSVGLSAWNERRQRQHFVEFVKWHMKAEGLRASQKALDARLLQLTPPQLHDRLVDDTELIDITMNASVIVCQVYEFPKWCCQLLPHVAAITIGDLLTAVDHLSKQCEVERIKNLGDMFLVSSNLLRRRSNPSDRICYFAYELQKALGQFNASSSAPIPLVSAIHNGYCIGAVLGTKFLRYDCFGPAINGGIEMLANCAPYETLLSESAMSNLQSPDLVMLENREVTNAQGKSVTVYVMRGRAEVELPPENSTPNAPGSANISATSQPLLSSVGPPSAMPGVANTSSKSTTEDNGELTTQKYSAHLRERLERGKMSSISIEGSIKALNGVIEGTELKRGSCCGWLDLHFASPAYEEEYFACWQHPNYGWYTSLIAFIVTGIFLSIVILERDLPYKGIGVAFQCLTIAFMVIRQGILSYFPEHRTLYRVSAVVFLFFAIVSSFAGAIATRPGLVGNDLLYLAGFYVAVIPFTLGLHLLFSTHFLCLSTFFLIAMLYLVSAYVYRAAIRYATPIAGTIMILILPFYFLYKAYIHRVLYRDQLRAEALLVVANAQSELRQALIDATIPQQVLQLIEGTAMLEHGGEASLRRSQVVSGNETIVVLVRFDEVQAELQHAEKNPVKFLSNIDAMLHQAETSVKKWCKSLAIVRMNGDTVMLSAPSIKNDSYLASVYLEAISVLLELRERSVSFSAVMTIDAAFAVIGQGEYPTFELVGPAMYYARAIMGAIPVPGAIVFSEAASRQHVHAIETVKKDIPDRLELSVPTVTSQSSSMDHFPATSATQLQQQDGPFQSQIYLQQGKQPHPPGEVRSTAKVFHPEVMHVIIGNLQTWRIRGVGVARVHYVQVPMGLSPSLASPGVGVHSPFALNSPQQ